MNGCGEHADQLRWEPRRGMLPFCGACGKSKSAVLVIRPGLASKIGDSMTNLYHAKDGLLVPINRKRLANEDQLQAWIAANPRLLGLEVLVLGREVSTEFGGRIDILGLDRDGNAV